MIDLAAIRILFSTTVAAEAGITIIRADGKGPKPDYPYGTWKVINAPIGSQHTEVETVTENVGDPTLADINRYERGAANISINFFGNTPDILYEKAGAVLNYFRFNKVPDCTVRIISPTIQDRTAFKEANYEYQVGFDITIENAEKHTKTIEALQSIEITPKIDGEEKEKFTVGG